MSARDLRGSSLALLHVFCHLLMFSFSFVNFGVDRRSKICVRDNGLPVKGLGHFMARDDSTGAVPGDSGGRMHVLTEGRVVVLTAEAPTHARTLSSISVRTPPQSYKNGLFRVISIRKRASIFFATGGGGEVTPPLPPKNVTLTAASHTCSAPVHK